MTRTSVLILNCIYNLCYNLKDNMCKWYLICWLLLSPFLAVGQDSSQIFFPVTNYDFGVIKETNGLVSYDFRFENRGATKLVITNVESSCGCTTPQWTVNEILPGESGIVRVEMDPYNRPGNFEKTIEVISNGIPRSYTLHIKGNVQYQPATLEEAFPYELGQLRMKDRVLNLGSVFSNQVTRREFELYNSGDDALILSDEVRGPDHIKVTFSPFTMKPKSRGIMIVQFDGVAKKELGFSRDEIVINSFEDEMSSKTLVVTATVHEYFTTNDHKKNSGPALTVASAAYDFGIVTQGEQVPMTFEIQNKGKDQLVIRKISASCDCISFGMDQKDLEPGERSELQVMFDTTVRIGNQEKFITVFSNDPDNPIQVLTFKGLIRKP